MISPRWHKVLRDIWSNKTRTIVVALSIAVGVFAFGSVFTTNDILIADINSQYQAIRPSTITMTIGSFDDSLVRWALRQREVVDARGVAVQSVKLIRRDGKTYILILNARDDYGDPSLNLISKEKGSWPTGRRELLFERTSLSLSGASVGESVVIELSSGRKYELKVSGTAHDLNAIPTGLFPLLTGYVSMKTLGGLGLPATYNQLDMATSQEFNKLASMEKPAGRPTHGDLSGGMPQFGKLAKFERLSDDLKERLQDMGVAVTSVQLREPGEHWAKKTVETFSLILVFIGSFSLILSGFLVVNTISALLAQQSRQIGMMKAIGGTAKQIIGIYVVLVAFYGLLALVVALPVGMLLSYLFLSALSSFLNVDIVNFHLPAWVFVLQVTAALLVPVLASFIPILHGVRVTVREAVSDYGISGKSQHGLLDRWLLRVRGLPRPVLLSIRNTFRRKGRLFIMLGTLTISGSLFITVVNVRGSLAEWSNDTLKTWFNYEVELSLDGSYDARGVERRAESLLGVTQAEGRTGIRVQYIKPDGTEGTPFSVVGLRPETDFVRPRMLSGRWLAKQDRNDVILSSRLADDMKEVRVGDSISLQMGTKERQWRVVGIMYMPFDRFAYADFDYVSSLKGEAGLASSVYVRTVRKDGQSQTDMAESLEKRLKETGIKVIGSMTSNVLSSTWASQFDFMVAFLLSMAGMTALIGGLGLAGMMSLNVMERTREIGIMRSIGASNGAVAGIVVTEGLLIGALSWGMAVPVSVPMSLLFNNLLGNAFFEEPLGFNFSGFGVGSWLAIVLVISVIATLLPAYRAARMSIRETLAYE
ncbi:MAG: hypothetical protein HW414_1434 [Dehalococcoidia bacterium]|nr:hypothetical protein [Dehalococcoidia bacterium]